MTGTELATHPGGAGARALSLSRCALRVTRGDQEGLERVLDGDALRIGKGPDADLVLRDPAVSRDHCEIVRDERGFLLRDLGSTNGTRLDGAEVREGYLHAGSVITIGRVELQVRTYDEQIELSPSSRDRFGELCGDDAVMRSVFGLLERIADTDATLLVGGETGTGKDALARSVHAASRRSKRPFVSVDCGALVASRVESELFGHEKGSFTGAVERRKGAFELAHHGTLFLDEIGELPLELQPRLLRVLETRRVRRVGGSVEVPVDLRVIAASHRNLLQEVERGKFRKDLYFRLAVVPVWLPPLRERRADVPRIAEQLLERICGEQLPGEPRPALTASVSQALASHDWPGNVRELRNVLERAVLLGRGRGGLDLAAAGIVPALGTGGAGSETADATFDPALSYGQTRAAFEADFERRYVRFLLARHHGNVSAAAREAGMDRKHLHHLAERHGLRSTGRKD
jgi:transcriptional regulator with GAF, ATPase, and Fis domain